jgi:predicted PurR-regulated permease PerM
MLKPAYLRYIWILHGIVLTVFVMWILRELLVPFAFAAVIAILLNPFQAWLSRKRLPRTLSIGITVLLALLVVAGMFYLILAQLRCWPMQVLLYHDRQQLNHQQFCLNAHLAP